jgi:hypothetical protein
MPRFAKALSHELIQFAKNVQLTANYWDSTSKSAFEFARQMSSPKLKKKNPQFECNLLYTESDDPPSLVAQFSDGSTWKTSTAAMKASDLRQEFFDRCARIEDIAEMSGNLSDTGGDKKGAAAKPAAKGAAPTKK